MRRIMSSTRDRRSAGDLGNNVALEMRRKSPYQKRRPAALLDLLFASLRKDRRRFAMHPLGRGERQVSLG
jgi:hypothetical protein